jgi:hypothetical protein
MTTQLAKLDFGRLARQEIQDLKLISGIPSQGKVNDPVTSYSFVVGNESFIVTINRDDLATALATNDKRQLHTAVVALYRILPNGRFGEVLGPIEYTVAAFLDEVLNVKRIRMLAASPRQPTPDPES